jgi:hypothetical protein
VGVGGDTAAGRGAGFRPAGDGPWPAGTNSCGRSGGRAGRSEQAVFSILFL